MANPSTLQLLIDIKAELAGLTTSVNQMRQLKTETENATRAGGALTGIFQGFAAGLGIGVTQELSRIPVLIGQMIRGGIDFNATLESSRIGIASVIKAFDTSRRFPTFDAALVESSKAVDLIKQKARETEASFRELLDGYQAAAGPAFAAGINSTRDQINLVTALSQAMSALRIPAREMSQEIRGVFEGDTSRQSRLNQVIRVTKEEIEQAALKGTAYQLVMGRLTSFSEGATRGQQSFNVMLSNVQDSLQQLGGIATANIFESLKNGLHGFVDELGSDQAREKAAAFGGWLGDVVKRSQQAIEEFLATRRKVSNFMRDLEDNFHLDLFTIVPGRSSASAAPSGADLAAAQEFARTAEERRQSILATVQAATAESAILSALKELEDQRANIASRLQDENAVIRHDAEIEAQELRDMEASFAAMVGTSASIASNMKATKDQIEAAIKATGALQEVQRQTAIKTAEAAGDKAAEFAAKRVDVYNDAFRKLLAAGVEPVGAARAADELASATEAAAQHQQDLRDATKSTAAAHRDVTAFIREEGTALQNIRQQQQLIRDDGFLTIDEKNARLLTLMREEIGTINANIKEGQGLLDGGTLDASTYEQVARSVQEATFRVQELAQQSRELTFGGQIKASLVEFGNNFGSVAKQIGSAITGSINTALDGTAQLLTDITFGTGNWRQTALQAEKQIVSSLIKVGLQMLYNATLGKLLTRQNTADQQVAGAQIAAAHAPAAAATSISSFGSSAVIGAIAAAAAIAAIIALLVGFEGGGYTGPGGTKRIAGVVHGREFVQPDPAVRYYGLPFMEAVRRRAIPAEKIQELIGNYRYPVTPRFGSFESGGAVAALADSADQRQSAADASAASSSPPQVVNNHALFYDRAEAVKWLKTQDGENFFVDLVRGTSHRLPKA